jgi:hypothetical protein
VNGNLGRATLRLQIPLPRSRLAARGFQPYRARPLDCRSCPLRPVCVGSGMDRRAILLQDHWRCSAPGARGGAGARAHRLHAHPRRGQDLARLGGAPSGAGSPTCRARLPGRRGGQSQAACRRGPCPDPRRGPRLTRARSPRIGSFPRPDVRGGHRRRLQKWASSTSPSTIF